MTGASILMIEDDEEMIALGELILKREGYNVLSATSGLSGLDVLRSSSVDLVLLDIMMDGLDGWEVLERIRSDERTAQVPVIILTARRYLEDKEQAERHACQYDDYVVKPFVVSDLLGQVAETLALERKHPGC